MLDVCQLGLFVGVDRHANLPRSDWLTSASTDALLLRNFFRGAVSKESDFRWRAVVGNNRSNPKRIDLLKAIARFAKDVRPDEPGLFYFSGHATMSDSGLVLKSFDAHEDFLTDTGLPLARILAIFKAESGKNKRFFIILDCCRDGARAAAADDIPANVCVLYACSNGDSAYEDTEGGVFARSLIESLEAISAESNAKHCSVHILCKRLGRQLFAWRPASALSFQLSGNWAESLYLPLVRRKTTAANDQSSGPEVHLKYCFSRRNVFEASLSALAIAVFDWYGISQQNQAGKQFVRAHFDLEAVQPTGAAAQAELIADVVRSEGKDAGSAGSSEELAWQTPVENYFFQVRIPEGCSRWTSSDFLVQILQAPVVDPQTLLLTWPGHIDFALFKEFRHPVDGEWFGAASGAPILKWTNKSSSAEYRGLATVAPLESGRTSVVITCETPDPYEASLFHLLPGLKDIFDLFRSIRI
jgi:hypothetical protein